MVVLHEHSRSPDLPGWKATPPARPEWQVGREELEDRAGETAGREQMEKIFSGEGTSIDVPEDEALEREYLLGFWSGVSEAIREYLKKAEGLSIDMIRSWDSVTQRIESTIRQANRPGENAMVNMEEVRNDINELAGAAEEKPMRLAA